MNDEKLSIKEIQVELTRRNYYIDLLHEEIFIRIYTKYKTLAIAMLFIILVILGLFIFKFAKLTLPMAIFIIVVWVIAGLLWYIGKMKEYFDTVKRVKANKLDAAKQLFALWHDYNTSDQSTKDTVFETDILPYVGLQKVKDLNNEDDNE